MTWSRVHIHCLVAIVLLALVLVHDPEANWSAQCDTELGTGLYLDTILLVARCGDGGLAWSAARHLRLDIGVCEGHAWRAAVDNGADREAMGLAIADGQSALVVEELGLLRT
jgi:hypothetical protein